MLCAKPNNASINGPKCHLQLTHTVFQRRLQTLPKRLAAPDMELNWLEVDVVHLCRNGTDP